MELMKLCALAVLGVLVALQLKQTRPEYGIYLVVAMGVLIFAYSFGRVREVFEEVMKLGDYLGGSVGYLKILMKVVGISYVCEFGSGICRDAGYGALGEQVEILGKLAVLFTGFPIFFALIQELEHL